MTNTEEPAAMQERDDLEEVYRLYAEGKRVTDSDLIRRTAIPGLGFFLGKVAGFRLPRRNSL